ncbi:hypothetical protein, partial [Lacticaseibacillus paracasei]|uniref:hypothetical protein n=1 Tax=Lacticaseibacillus paracasei TaxID=1597 RepID=UPI001957F0D7
IFAHAITTDAWRNSLDHYQEFVIIVALDLKIEDTILVSLLIKGKSSPLSVRLVQGKQPL